MGRWRVLAVVGLGWTLGLFGCGSDNPGGGLLDGDGGVTGSDEGGTMMTAMMCRNSKDCMSDQVCDPTSKTCVQCVTQADCAMGMVCQGSQCMMPAAACKNSLDCKADPNNPVCDPSTGKCVVCVVATDCPMNNDCTDHACKPYVACANSLDCPQGQVCETTRMRCVECIGTNDCPMTSKCVNNACKVKCSSDTQCTGMGQLCDLTQGICAQCISATDCKPDQYCLNGTCTPDVCTGGTTSCQTNSVVTCRADGSGYGSPLSCGSQVCVPSGMTATCKDKLCTPSVVGCNPTGSQVVKCSADGLSQTVQTDCAANNQICVAAQCITGVCAPSKRYCSGNESRQCSVTGDSYTVAQTCQLTEYCDAANTGTCKTKVCNANMPACNARVLTTCNADGSGFVAGGTDCSPKFCSGGACVDYLFHEDFEDGDSLGWTSGAGIYSSKMVTNVTAANGTLYSLYMVKSTTSFSYVDGLYQAFGSPLTPSTIGWYERIPTSPLEYAGVVSFFSTAATTNLLARVYFSYSGYIVLTDLTSSSPKTYALNTWYHLEFRNINWINRTFDFYVDGIPLRTGDSFGSTGNAVGRMDLADYYSSDAAYFDQIDFLP